MSHIIYNVHTYVIFYKLKVLSPSLDDPQNISNKVMISKKCGGMLYLHTKLILKTNFFEPERTDQIMHHYHYKKMAHTHNSAAMRM